MFLVLKFYTWARWEQDTYFRIFTLYLKIQKLIPNQ